VTGDCHWPLHSFSGEELTNRGSFDNAATSGFNGLAQALDEFERMHGGAMRCESPTKDLAGIAVTLRCFCVQELQRVTVAKELRHLCNFGPCTVVLYLASSEGDRACLHLVRVNAIGGKGCKQSIDALLHRGAKPFCGISAVLLGNGVIARGEQR